MELARLLTLLADPKAYPLTTDRVEIHQTNISAVFLAGAFAYKIKKPVNLGFVDYSTLAKRRHWCLEEVRLNRRLAPDVYLGVVPIAGEGEGDGGSLCVEGPGPVVEWAVKMKRLPEEAMLRSALAHGRVNQAAMEAVGRRVAEFHRSAGRSPEFAAYARFEAVVQNARENFEQSAPQVGDTVSAAVFERLGALTEKRLQQLRSCIEDRAARGMPCQTHGDLRLDHVYLFPDSPPPADLVIIDCIEFNPRYRAADPVADLAFLMMDLILEDRRDLALVLRDAYFQASGDLQGRTLVPFYVAYRAAVRAKVEGMEACEPEVGRIGRAKARAQAQAHWLLTLGELEEPRHRPCLVLVAGLPGTGKSTVARILASRAGFTVIRSDQVRKELAGLSPDQSAAAGYGAGIYAPAWTDRTYLECSRRAGSDLFEGKRVLVDATFRDEAQRRHLLGLARHLGVPGLLLVCQAQPALVQARLEERRDDLSDADWAVYLETAQRWQPLGAESRRRFHAIDTGQPDTAALVQALDVLREHGLWA
jgi:aminoglycoside phosphotransferase family enzyme/predicted kinase